MSTTSTVGASAYFLDHEVEAEARATFAVIVDNEPGVLHRVVGLFSARGYNIESLTVAETDHAVQHPRLVIDDDGEGGASLGLDLVIEEIGGGADG